MNRKIKIVIGAAGLLLTAILLFFINAMFGNPFSKALAAYRAPKYIEAAYPKMDLKVDNIRYNFKTGGYLAQIKAPDSLDIYFSVNLDSFGKVKNDNYAEYVSSGFNTWSRLNTEYDTMVDKVFDDPDFKYPSEICFGEIKILSSTPNAANEFKEYGIRLETLELDKKYDLKKLAKAAGHIVFYAQKEEVTTAMASKILLDLKNILDQEKIPFYAIDFTLEKPLNEDGTPNLDTTVISVKDFLYRDIYEKDLNKRVLTAAKKLQKYYQQEDAKKEAEINSSKQK